MGHQPRTPLPPLADRVGCRVHTTYNPDCLGCHIFNGGGND